jgi:hypothetical protein
MARLLAGLAAVSSACSGASEHPADAGDAAVASCGWATSPQLAWTQPGAAPTNLWPSGDIVFSAWLEGGAIPSGSEVVATHVPDLQTTLVVHRSSVMTLLGVSDEGIYVGESDENSTWTSLELLHRDGSVARQVATTVGGQPLAGPQLRVGSTLYAISGNALYAEHQGAWSALAEVGAVGQFAEMGPGPLLVMDPAHSKVCAVDEATGRAQPCVDVPAVIDGSMQVYNIGRAALAGSQWGLLGLTDDGDALIASAGATWQSLAVTHNQWVFNDIAPRGQGWMWLRQDAIDQNTYRTSALTPDPLWVVDGQAFDLTATTCGTMFAVANQGIYAVAP